MKYGFFLFIIFSLSISVACGNKTKKSDDIETKNDIESSFSQNDSEDIVLIEDTTLYDMPYYTPYIKDEKNYFHQNSKFKDWDVNDRKKVVLRSIVEKDGEISELKLFRGCGIEEMDKEAYRLIKGAPLDPGRDKDGNPIRCVCTFLVRFPPL